MLLKLVVLRDMINVPHLQVKLIALKIKQEENVYGTIMHVQRELVIKQIKHLQLMRLVNHIVLNVQLMEKDA